MENYIVTVKLPKNPNHDPKNKIPGECPVGGHYCTDVTGEHHSIFVQDAPGAKSLQALYESWGFHVTRVERVNVSF